MKQLIRCSGDGWRRCDAIASRLCTVCRVPLCKQCDRAIYTRDGFESCCGHLLCRLAINLTQKYRYAGDDLEVRQ